MKFLISTSLVIVFLPFILEGKFLPDYHIASSSKNGAVNSIQEKFLATSDLIDASIYSFNSLNSLIKKENYRNKIATFNNPTSSELGFSLEAEIQTALKPILIKAKNTNTSKFASVVSSIMNNPLKNQLNKSIFGTTGVFSSILSLVGNLAITEKKITQQDLDSLILTMSKYFAQYEKLNQANRSFDQNIDKFSLKLQELQFDVKEYMIDIITVVNKTVNRQDLKNKTLEELQLKYLDKSFIEINFSAIDPQVKYPIDGIKTGKEVVYAIQKLFIEYQKIYTANYNEIRVILLQSKDLGKHINIKQVDLSLAELQELYNDSKNADLLNLRLNTLSEKLRILVITEQLN